jgi:2-methylcitrate dehydratase PrpD
MTNGSSLPATRRLAQFAADLKYDDLPEDIRSRLGLLLTDLMRVSAIGYRMPWVAKLRTAFAPLQGSGPSSVLLDDARCDPVHATYVNSTIAGSLDWDDTHVGAMLHPGVVVWPAALAVAERTGASGRALAEAVVAGYETMIRIGLSIQPSHFRRGFQSTPTCGVFGAAVAAGKLLGLNANGMADAIGLAASYAGGPTQFFVSGSEVKRLHAGKGAAGGVEAALLAHAGLTGPHDVIEGEQGFAKAYADAFDPAAIERGLGTDYAMRGLTLKTHAGSARLQAAVDATFAIAATGIAIESIESVEIGVPKVIQGRLTRNDPQDLQQTQMSVPFSVAMALVYARDKTPPCVLMLEDYEASLTDPRVQALAQRTRCVPDPEIEKATTTEFVPARVTVALRDGTQHTRKEMIPAGAPQRPLTWDEIRSRFLVVAGPLLTGADPERWLDDAGRLADLPDVRPLLRLRARPS